MNALLKAEQIRPETPVAEAGSVLLMLQLKEVRRRLKLSARSDLDDTDNVHQLRIATRRGIAMMDVFRDYLSQKQIQKTARLLKRIRRVAARARDLDVLIQKRGSVDRPDRTLIKRLKKKRRKAQGPIVEVNRTIRRDRRFAVQVDKLVSSLKKNKLAAEHSFDHCARRSLGHALLEFFQKMPEEVEDLEELHRFRIAAKRFRYRMEVLELAFEPKMFTRLTRDIKSLQDMLGELNDHSVALECFQRMRRKGEKVAGRVVREEKQGLKQSKQRFVQWWTVDKALAIWDHVESLVTPPQNKPAPNADFASDDRFLA
jgi:CHAD domain-containing protein